MTRDSEYSQLRTSGVCCDPVVQVVQISYVRSQLQYQMYSVHAVLPVVCYSPSNYVVV